MKKVDEIPERFLRRLAKSTSRRGFLSKMGIVLSGAAVAPLLPVTRASRAESDRPRVPEDAEVSGPEGDDRSCEYWRYCAIDGFLCTHCGGTTSSCPPGTVPSSITWIGTCVNPADNKEYVISYNDCCGKAGCGQGYCARNEGDLPVYYPPLSNDINWCAGSEGDIAYHCSMARVIGLATDDT